MMSSFVITHVSSNPQAYALMSLFYGIGVVIYIIPMALKPLSETSIALKRMKV